MKNRILIVGAGIAGLTAAAYLCKAGFEPVILEQSNSAGGLVHSFKVDGFHFDAGTRAFENSGILLPMLKNLDITMEFVANPITMRLANQSFTMDGSSSITKYEQALLHLFPENKTDIGKIIALIRKTMEYMDVLYAVDNPLFNENLRDLTYLRREFLPWFLSYLKKMRKVAQINQPIYEELGQLTDNRALIDVIAQHFFSRTPAFFALSYFWLYQEYLYPKNGTSELIEHLVRYIEEHHGKLLYGQEVHEIQINRKLLMTQELSLSFDKLVWAADGSALYQSLNTEYIDEFHKRENVKRKRREMQKSKGSDSVISLFLGLDLPPAYFRDKHEAHLFFTPNHAGISSITRQEKTDRITFFEKYFEKTTYEISIPALRNPALAPAAKTGLIISTLADYKMLRDIKNNGRYAQFKKQAAKKIITVLESTIYPGISRHIEYQSISTPLTYEKKFLNKDGALNGWSFENDKMPCITDIRKMKKTIRTPFKNIFHIGQWVYAPAGVPTSILTGKLAADKIIQKKNRKGR